MMTASLSKPWMRAPILAIVYPLLFLSTRCRMAMAFVRPPSLYVGRHDEAFSVAPPPYATCTKSTMRRRMVPPNNDRFNRDLDEKARRSAETGSGEMAAGAILGGLLGGPFGALFGAQIGAGVGASRAVDRAKQEEMQRLGVTPEMLEMAKDAGAALERGFEGLRATRESLQTQQSFARRLSTEVDGLYEKAQAAIKDGEDQLAKKYLFDRNSRQEKLKKVLLACAEEKGRLETMERNIEALEERAMETESLLRRTVGAKALQDTSSQFALANEDPLLKKFKEMGID